MIVERGTVVEAPVDGAGVHVVVTRSAGCSQCHEASGCGAALIVASRQTLRVSLPLPARAALAPGDPVEIALSGRALLSGVALVYLVPLLGLLLGAGLAQAGTGAESCTIAGGLLGLLAGLLLARSRARRVAADLRYHPVILQRP